MKDLVKRYGFIIVGQFIGAVAFNQILLPNNLVAVGFGGIATVINKMTGMNLQLLLVLLCTPVIIWAFFRYKRKQVYFAALCFGLFTFYIGVVDKIIPPFVTDPIIASVAGGILLGLAGGMVISQGVANGPEAIIGLYLKEKRDITIGNFFLILNTVIIFSSIIYGDLTLIIYSLMSNYVAGKITDFVIVGNKRYYIVNVMSDKYLDITDYIHNDLGRGVTFIQSMDTSNVQKKMMLKTVVSKRELVKLKYYVKGLKDNSFVYATESTGLLGGGFEG